MIERELPSTKIIFISLKPSIARWDSWGKMQVANAKIRAICDADDSLVFADVGPPMLGTNGEPKPELFVDDGLHMTDAGYDTCADVLKPLLRPESLLAPTPSPNLGVVASVHLRVRFPL